MTQLDSLGFNEWIDLADRYLNESLRGKPLLHHDAESANWRFQSQLADVRLLPSGRIMPRFLWHEENLPGMRIGELEENPELSLQQEDARRFGNLAARFFYGDRAFIRTLTVGRRA